MQGWYCVTREYATMRFSQTHANPISALQPIRLGSSIELKILPPRARDRDAGWWSLVNEESALRLEKWAWSVVGWGRLDGSLLGLSPSLPFPSPRLLFSTKPRQSTPLCPPLLAHTCIPPWPGSALDWERAPPPPSRPGGSSLSLPLSALSSPVRIRPLPPHLSARSPMFSASACQFVIIHSFVAGSHVSVRIQRTLARCAAHASYEF